MAAVIVLAAVERLSLTPRQTDSSMAAVAHPVVFPAKEELPARAEVVAVVNRLHQRKHRYLRWSRPCSYLVSLNSNGEGALA